MIRVYTASKLTTAEFWRDLDKKWPFVFFHARWLKHNIIGTKDSADLARRFWVEDEEDVEDADALLLYAKEGEHLRGGLVEAGIAIANRVPVIVVGNHPDYGTWQYHPRVIRAANWAEAEKELIRIMQEKTE